MYVRVCIYTDIFAYIQCYKSIPENNLSVTCLCVFVWRSFENGRWYYSNRYIIKKIVPYTDERRVKARQCTPAFSSYVCMPEAIKLGNRGWRQRRTGQMMTSPWISFDCSRLCRPYCSTHSCLEPLTNPIYLKWRDLYTNLFFSIPLLSFVRETKQSKTKHSWSPVLRFDKSTEEKGLAPQGICLQKTRSSWISHPPCSTCSCLGVAFECQKIASVLHLKHSQIY